MDWQAILGIFIAFIALNCLVIGGVIIGLLIAYLRIDGRKHEHTR